VTRGISAKEQREDRLRLRRKQLQDAAQALAGAKKPVPAIKVPTVAKRASVSPPSRRDK
jgi:AcrR family transcriptional regulator